jgi:hypothetical protein
VTGRWVDAAALADHLSVTADYVYRHADRLGGVRLGTGPRARLRFDVGLVDRLLRDQVVEQPQARTATRKRRPRKDTPVDLVPLLPIRGRR